MHRSRMQRIVVLLVVVAILLSVCTARVFLNRLPAVLVALSWLWAPAILVVLFRRPRRGGDEQPVSLLALLPSRAPPVLAILA